MRQERTARANSRRSSAILLLVAVTTLAACDNEVVVSPSVTGIDFGPSSVVGVAIVANLTTDDPVCQEATLFYDGQELAGARTECVESSDGCAHLQIEANAPPYAGPHTIGIEVLRQKRDVVRYHLNGEVLVQRSGIPPILVLPLEPKQRQLQVNDRVTYEVDIPD